MSRIRESSRPLSDGDLSRELSPLRANLYLDTFDDQMLVTTLLNRMIFTPADFYYDAAGSADIPSAPPAAPADGGTSTTISPVAAEAVPAFPTRGCFLTDEARRRFVTHFERRMNTVVLHPSAQIRTTWRGCIDIQVGHFIQLLRGEVQTYVPIEIR
jgi:hypothetical protein